MKDKLLMWSIILLATIFLAFGMFHLFRSHGILDQKFEEADYVTAFFSLSGVLFFCATIIHQVREYKLQVIELKASVDAQTKSSKALETQTDIIYEQTTNSLVFSMIDRFYEIKCSAESQSALDRFCEEYSITFANELLELRKSNLAEDTLTWNFARAVKSNISRTLQQKDYYHSLRRVVQFSYNLLYLVAQRKTEKKEDWLTPYIYNQLSRNENLLIHLFNLMDFGVPLSDKIHWNYYLTEDFVKMVTARAGVSGLNVNQLTNEFNALKQKLA